MRIRNIVIGILVILAIASFAMLIQPDQKLKWIAKDIVRDHARFTPNESIDLSMAMKLVTHAPPQMLNPPKDAPPLLLFPPSADELARLTGSQ